MSEISTENVTPAADQISRSSRQKPPPDPTAQARRNLQIFKMVEIEKRAHKEVAELFHLRRSRVTQIVQKIRLDLPGRAPTIRRSKTTWLSSVTSGPWKSAAWNMPWMPQPRPSAATPPNSCSGRTRRHPPKKYWRAGELERDRPPRQAGERAAHQDILRVSRDLGQLNEREIANNPVGEKHSHYDLFKAIASVLAEWSSRVPRSRTRPARRF